MRRCAVEAENGYDEGTEMYRLCVFSPVVYYNKAINEVMAGWAIRSAFKYALLSENEQVFYASANQLVADRQLHVDMPLIVLTREAFKKSETETQEQRDRLNLAWTSMQKDTASISTIGIQRVVTGSGHMIPFEKPSAVNDAIIEVLKKASH